MGETSRAGRSATRRRRFRPTAGWPRPPMTTSPLVAASNPPNRCSKVLLPEPDAPTIATCSPLAIERLTPSNTRTSTLPCRYTLRKSRHDRAASLIAQRLGRIDFGGAVARVDGREQAHHEREKRRQQYVRRAQFGRQVADLVDVFRQELETEHVLDERHDDIYIQRERDSRGDSRQ